MKVFLQNGLTREFLRAPDEWTPVAALAMEFNDSAAAIQFCLNHELRNMRVVLHFPEFDYNVHLPVNLPRLIPKTSQRRNTMSAESGRKKQPAGNVT